MAGAGQDAARQSRDRGGQGALAAFLWDCVYDGRTLTDLARPGGMMTRRQACAITPWRLWCRSGWQGRRGRNAIIGVMATFRITEAELARDVHAVLAKVQEGAEVL